MSDIAVENYKKSVVKLFDIWGKEVERIGKELAAVDAALDKLEAIKTPGPDDRKKIQELTKKRAACRKRIDDATASLRLNLIVIALPPKADEKELVKLPAWMKEIIKKKGIPLGKNVSIAPDIGFDFKAKKLKSFGVTIRW